MVKKGGKYPPLRPPPPQPVAAPPTLSVWDGDPDAGGKRVAGPIEADADGVFRFPPGLVWNPAQHFTLIERFDSEPERPVTYPITEHLDDPNCHVHDWTVMVESTRNLPLGVTCPGCGATYGLLSAAAFPELTIPLHDRNT